MQNTNRYCWINEVWNVSCTIGGIFWIFGIPWGVNLLISPLLDVWKVVDKPKLVFSNDNWNAYSLECMQQHKMI